MDWTAVGITVGTLAVPAGIAWIVSVENRLTRSETTAENIKEKLTSIDEKFDRLIEKLL